VNWWAYDLMAENHLPEATDLLKLDVQLFPGSANAFGSLREAYMKSGQGQRAIGNYTKSLALNPTNDHAKEQLEVLGATPAVDLFATTEKMVEGR
jgi:tetratricopeptide (TPR) repeat protein